MKFDDLLKDRKIFENGYHNLKPQVSIVMPTYCRNKERLLNQCIESVLGQSFKNFEFIIVDDGSVDGTETVVRNYAKCDPRIVYVRHPENSGLPAVRTDEGILLARAPYVAFIFDDNVWVPDALEALLEEMASRTVDVVYGNTDMAIKDGKPFLLGAWPLTRELLEHLNTIPNGATLCRREFFQQYGLYDPHLILRRLCDWDLWLRGLRLGAAYTHVEKTLGMEHGTASELSIGSTVHLDYKISYAYMACEKRLKERTETLLPEMIGKVDVFDPTRVIPYLRDLGEWESIEETVYRPFFETHPYYTYERPSLHNRLYDTALEGCGLNHTHHIFKNRLRILLVSNRFDRVVREWKEALSSKINAIVLSCAEWQVSAFRPSEVDLVMLFDCAALYLRPFIEEFHNADIPVIYCVIHGLEDAYAGDSDPLLKLDLTKCQPILETMKMTHYFSLPGVSWSMEQQEAAKSLIELSDQILLIGGPKSRLNNVVMDATEVGFIPNKLPAGMAIDCDPPGLKMYLGDIQMLSQEMMATLKRIFQHTPPGRIWELYVFPKTTLPRGLGKFQKKFRVTLTSETLPTLAKEMKHSYLAVPETILARYSSFHRHMMEEDLTINGSALSGLLEFGNEVLEGLSFDALQESLEVFRTHCAQRGVACREDVRKLHLTNFGLAALLMKKLQLLCKGEGRDFKKAAVLLNSPFLSGSETVGLLVAQALSQLGFHVQTCVPKFHDYSPNEIKDAGDVNKWLRNRGLSPVVEAEYGMGSKCFFLPEKEVEERALHLQEWLDRQRVSLVICAGFIPEPLICLARDRVVFVGLMQPWGYHLDLMTFMRDRSQGVFSDSRWAAKQWSRWIAPPVEWIPTIVEPEYFGPSQPSLSTKPVRIAIGGTIQPRKRQLEALQAIMMLLKKGHDLEVNVYGYELSMMAGYANTVRSMADTLRLKGRVHFHGLVDLKQIIENNHIFLMPSMDESMPQTLLFMLAAGLVPVACPAGGIEEVVRDGETGFLAKGFAVGEIAEALRQALEQKGQWSELVARGRALLVDEYTEPIVVYRLLRFMLQGTEIALSPGVKLFETRQGKEPTHIVDREEWRERVVEKIHHPTVRVNGTLIIGPEINKVALRYHLISEDNNLSGLQFNIGTFHTSPRGSVTLSIFAKSSRQLLRKIKLDLDLFGDNSWIKANFEPILNSKDKEFKVIVSAEVNAGRCALYEVWPHDGSWMQTTGRRIQRRLHRHFPIQVSRSYPAFFPLYRDQP